MLRRDGAKDGDKREESLDARCDLKSGVLKEEEEERRGG